MVLASKNFTETFLKECKTNACPEITINYIVISGNEKAGTLINSKIEAFIIRSLMLEESLHTDTVTTIRGAASQFVTTYRQHSEEFPETAPYVADISVINSYTSDELMSFEMQHYLFTGGAHGYGSIHYMNVDPHSGEEFPSGSLFTDLEKLSKIAEKKFREAYKIPSGESINSSGFWFEDDQFYLPETIGFKKDSIVLQYNLYEIASYAEGPLELKIPFTEIASLLTKI